MVAGSIIQSFFMMFIFFGGAQTTPLDVDPDEMMATHKIVASYLQPNGIFHAVSYRQGALKAALAPLNEIQLEESRVENIFHKIPGFIEKLGLYELTAVGGSVIPRGDGLCDGRIFYAITEKGMNMPFWTGVFGTKDQGTKMLELLPRDSAVVLSTNSDMAIIWNLVQRAVFEFGVDGKRSEFDDLMTKWDALSFPPKAVFESMTGKATIALLLDKNTQVPLPLGTQFQPVPMPGFIGIFELKNSDFSREFMQLLTEEGNMVLGWKDINGVKTRTFSIAGPSPIPLVVTCTRIGSYFVVTSTPEIMASVLDTKKNGGGLLKTPVFVSAFGQDFNRHRGLFYVSPTTVQTFNAIISAAGDSMADMDPNMGVLSAFIKNAPEKGMGFVATAEKEGILLKTVGNGMMPKYAISGNPAQKMGLLSAISIPSFFQARTTSHSNACINNLRQISGAQDQHLLNEGPPLTPDAVNAYLMTENPVCPACGKPYDLTIDPPICPCVEEFPEHVLP